MIGGAAAVVVAVVVVVVVVEVAGVRVGAADRLARLLVMVAVRLAFSMAARLRCSLRLSVLGFAEPVLPWRWDCLDPGVLCLACLRLGLPPVRSRVCAFRTNGCRRCSRGALSCFQGVLEFGSHGDPHLGNEVHGRERACKRALHFYKAFLVAAPGQV